MSDTVTLTNITPDSIDVPLLGIQLGPGETADVPVAQEDGSPIVWSPAFFQVTGGNPADDEDVPFMQEMRPEDDVTVPQLQDKLRAAGLPVSGTKDELKARLAAAPSPESTQVDTDSDAAPNEEN